MHNIILFQEHPYAGGKVFHRTIQLPVIPRRGEFITLNFKRGGQRVLGVEHVFGEMGTRVFLKPAGLEYGINTSDQAITEMAKDGWLVDEILESK